VRRGRKGEEVRMGHKGLGRGGKPFAEKRVQWGGVICCGGVGGIRRVWVHGEKKAGDI